ncbi:copper resistance CopC family protein [Plantibacter sp. YIM 135249]|uniref:copper resistance CopC family protein n=1 Tax=Plantibacter sp. YIM 135249 TaxID=3423918 RepID=UPI003D357419
MYAVSAGGLLALCLVLMSSVPAVAHDELVSSSPAAGAMLDAGPEEVRLRFSEELLPLGAAIIVEDPAGKQWNRADVTLEGDTLRSALAPDMTQGTYRLVWRVVSSDGHPISGVVPFSIGSAVDPDAFADRSMGTPPPVTSDGHGGAGWFRIGTAALIGAAIALSGYLLFLRIRRVSTRPQPPQESP